MTTPALLDRIDSILSQNSGDEGTDAALFERKSAVGSATGRRRFRLARAGRATLAGFSAEQRARLEENAARAVERVQMEEQARVDAMVGAAAIGSTVTFTDLNTGLKEVKVIVQASEAAAAEGRISVFAPLAKALLGTRPGDLVELSTPRGVRRLRVESVA